jgi:hypothetical protein
MPISCCRLPLFGMGRHFSGVWYSPGAEQTGQGVHSAAKTRQMQEDARADMMIRYQRCFLSGF